MLLYFLNWILQSFYFKVYNEYVGRCWTGEGAASTHDDVSVNSYAGTFTSSDDCRNWCDGFTGYTACEYDGATLGCNLYSGIVVIGGDNNGGVACWVFTGKFLKTRHEKTCISMALI